MTYERKENLFNEMLGWMIETSRGSEELFNLLHKRFGMTQAELHECHVSVLDDYFPQDARSMLKAKVMANYNDYKAFWLKMEPIELIGICDEMESITRMMKELPSAVTEEQAEYLLRFQSPLSVVSDLWLSRNGMETLNVDDEMTAILWDITYRQVADEDYALEPDCTDEIEQQM